jgi:BatD DUF11 like domain
MLKRNSNKRFRNLKTTKTLFALLAIFYFTGICLPAEISISAGTNKTTISSDETLELNVTVSAPASSIPKPSLPSMPNFSIYSAGQSESISIVNGRISSRTTYFYNLSPRFAGKATIGPIKLKYEGKEYSTEPIDVTITSARQGMTSTPQTKPSQPSTKPFSSNSAKAPEVKRGKDVFVTASVDKKDSYVNEQLTLSVRFYTAVSLLGNPEYVSPPTKGFISEDLPPVRSGQSTINDRLYYYTEIKSALFPATSGELTIGPATARYQVRKDFDPFAGDLLQQFMSQGSQMDTKEVTTNPIKLSIKPLPEEGKPSSFSGAVGKFTISAKANPTTLKAGETTSLVVTIQGEGNLISISPPKLPPMESLRVYDTISSMNINKSNDRVSGSKTFKTIIIPKSSGKITIPKIGFSFFDIKNEKYEEVYTDEITLDVEPGDISSAPQVTFNGTQQAQSLQSLNEDIRYVIENKKSSLFSKLFNAFSKAGWINLIPILLIVFTFAYKYISGRLQGDIVTRKSKYAYQKAKSQIAKAVKESQNQNIHLAMSIMSNTLRGYLCDKLNCKPGGQTFRNILTSFKNKHSKLSEEAVKEMTFAWNEIESLRFAPSSKENDEKIKKSATMLINALNAIEKELSK